MKDTARLLLLISFICFTRTGIHGQTVVTMRCAEDARVFSVMPGTNDSIGQRLGPMAWTWQGVPGVMRGFLKFDLSPSSLPASCAVDSAFLYLYPAMGFEVQCPRSYCNDVHVTRVLQPWSDNSIIWTNQPMVASTSSPQDKAYIPFDSCNCGYNPGCWFTNIAVANITDMVNYWLQNPAGNYGVMLSLVTEGVYNSKNFASSNHLDTALHPKLVLYFPCNVNAADSNCYRVSPFVSVPGNNYTGPPPISPAFNNVQGSNNILLLDFGMPNVFTPNGDLLNDFFLPVKLQGVKNFRILIFNRWGQQLYESTDITAGWDGNHEGKQCPDGVYYWIAEVNDLSLHGMFTLLR